MRLSKTLVLSAVPLILLGLTIPASFSQNSSATGVALTTRQQRRVEEKALQTYSTFDSGISSMSCEGAVDWNTLFQSRTSASFREQVLPVLNGIRFLVTLQKDGTMKLLTHSTVAPTTQEAAERARASIQSFSGVIATVFEGWARFAVAADLPAAIDAYRLDKVGDHYLVTYKNGPADVAVAMDRSFSMGEERINTPYGSEIQEGSMLMHPQFTATPRGYLVTSWNVAFPGGKGSGLSVETRYMQVDNIEVPAEMTLHSSLPSFGAVTLPLTLSNYQFSR